MDIQISSNFERLLFDLFDRGSEAVKARMAEFQATGAFGVTPAAIGRARALFAANAVDDAATKATIGDLYRTTGYVLDPHSAVGVAAARRATIDPAIPVVALACAHPAKFPEVVTAATGVHPKLPPHLADLFERPERRVTLPSDLATVQRYIRDRARIARPTAA